MANFLAIYDPIEERRLAFEKKCSEEIALFDDLKRGKLSQDNFTVLWAANKRAPVSTHQNKEETAVVLGDAIRPGSDERLSAKVLSREWSNTEKARQNFCDGYYCAIRFDVKTGFFIGGDILGLFPIYYFSDGEVTLAASSPELFRHHDSFEPKLCMEGLTGMLLTMHSVEGLSLWKDVYRLKEGHILASNLKGKPQEIIQYKLPLSDKYFGLPFSHQVELIHEKMDQAVTRHAPEGNKYSMLFSGGLDTRMLAGFLQKREKNITAITFGKKSDQEMKIAKKVAKTLPYNHKCIDRSNDNHVEFAKLSAKWEHGLHGFNTIQAWGYKQHLEKQTGSRVVSGIYHDGVFSSNYANLIQEEDNSDQIFDKILLKTSEWGIPVDDLEELFEGVSTNDKSKVIVQKLRKNYYSHAKSDYQRTWCYELFQGRRFHLGGVIWKMSFGAWPVIPIIDSAILELMAGLPLSTTSERRAQRQLVSTYFPDLARIVFDNNNNRPEPLTPTWQFLFHKYLISNTLPGRAFNAVKRRVTGPWNANLYYHRIYNINNAGWKSVRTEAELARSLTTDIFNQKKLYELVPPPDENIDRKLVKASGMKSLLGFLLWMQNQ
jgi:asparagine synthase (glutamine-hydrolysing)